MCPFLLGFQNSLYKSFPLTFFCIIPLIKVISIHKYTITDITIVFIHLPLSRLLMPTPLYILIGSGSRAVQSLICPVMSRAWAVSKGISPSPPITTRTVASSSPGDAPTARKWKQITETLLGISAPMEISASSKVAYTNVRNIEDCCPWRFQYHLNTGPFHKQEAGKPPTRRENR